MVWTNISEEWSPKHRSPKPKQSWYCKKPESIYMLEKTMTTVRDELKAKRIYLHTTLLITSEYLKSAETSLQ